jgi:hypothetical protein
VDSNHRPHDYESSAGCRRLLRWAAIPLLARDRGRGVVPRAAVWCGPSLPWRFHRSGLSWLGRAARPRPRPVCRRVVRRSAPLACLHPRPQQLATPIVEVRPVDDPRHLRIPVTQHVARLLGVLAVPRGRVAQRVEVGQRRQLPARDAVRHILAAVVHDQMATLVVLEQLGEVGRPSLSRARSCAVYSARKTLRWRSGRPLAVGTE